MVKTKLTKLLFNINIILLLSLIVLSLGLYAYRTNIYEGLTKEDIRAKANEKNAKLLGASQPKSMVLPKNFDILLADSTTYDEEEIKSRNTFSSKNPGASYSISSTSEEMPNQNTVPQPFGLGETKTVTIPLETSKFNDYIAIAPDAKSAFPPSFTLTITNKESENGMQIWLWGSMPSRGSVPTNGIIGSDNLNKTPYVASAFLTDPANGLTIAGVNIGNNALNIVGDNIIYDKNFKNIGTVSSNESSITVNCTNSKGITGILIYLGFADKTL